MTLSCENLYCCPLLLLMMGGCHISWIYWRQEKKMRYRSSSYITYFFNCLPLICVPYTFSFLFLPSRSVVMQNVPCLPAYVNSAHTLKPSSNPTTSLNKSFPSLSISLYQSFLCWNSQRSVYLPRWYVQQVIFLCYVVCVTPVSSSLYCKLFKVRNCTVENFFHYI